MNVELERNIAVFQEHFGVLKKDYGVVRIGVFGSVARSAQTRRSDVDVLVEFSRPIGLFKFLELEDFLSRLLGRKVDLVTAPALKPFIRQKALKDVVFA